MSIDCIWLNTNASSCCLGIIGIGWELVTQKLPPLWQVDKFSLSSTAAFLPERMSLYLSTWQQPLVSSMLSTEPGCIRQQTWRDFNKPQPKWAICCFFIFLNTSETSPNICCFLHFGRDPAMLWMLPGPAVMLSATQEQLGQKGLLGFFCFVCLFVWIFCLFVFC